MFEGFLLGVIVTASLAASAFFLKFWRQTHDKLFLGFSAAFAIEGINRLAFLFLVNALAVISYSHVLLAEGAEALARQHYLWGLAILVIVFYGPGAISVDRRLMRDSY